jgi:hypothetical protein
MKYLLFLLIYLGVTHCQLNSILCLVAAKSQNAWDSTRNWKIYKLQKFQQVFQIPPDSLRYLTRASLNDDSMHMYLNTSKPLTTNPAWMGCYLVSYESADGSVRKAIISHYAGFFYSEFHKTYFQISSEEQQAWLNYISGAYINIH